MPKKRRVIDEVLLLEGSGVGIPAYPSATLSMSFELTDKNCEVETVSKKETKVLKEEPVPEPEAPKEEPKVEEEKKEEEVPKEESEEKSVNVDLAKDAVKQIVDETVAKLFEQMDAKKEALTSKDDSVDVPKFKDFGVAKQDDWLESFCEHPKVKSFFGAN